MSFPLNYLSTLDVSTGETVFFSDTTVGYGTGGNIGYSDVKQVRLVCGNYKSETFPVNVSVGDTLYQWVQYQKTSLLPSTYDDVIVNSGDFYIPFIQGITVLSGDTFIAAGFASKYIPPATYLPTSSHNILNLDPSYWQLGYNEVPLTVFDSQVFSLQYEIYQDTTPNPLITVVIDKQYIVTGNTGVCTYNGSDYKIGMVFIAADNGVVTFTGDSTLKVLYASAFNYWTWVWDLNKRLLLVGLNQENCGCRDNPVICQIRDTFYVFEWSSYLQWVSVSKNMANIDWINQQLLILERAEGV